MIGPIFLGRTIPHHFSVVTSGPILTVNLFSLNKKREFCSLPAADNFDNSIEEAVERVMDLAGSHGSRNL